MGNGVAMSEARPARPSTSALRAPRGRVYLVGAGPGDPELLTLRAHRILTTARVVAFDELVGPEILGLAPESASLIAVGRRRGTHPDAPSIHPAIIDLALAGHDVVRLKGGDPLVFGRGGEEAAELAALSIPFEIVPGVSAALGAAASTGIPLTHRDVASSVTFATAHLRDGVDGKEPAPLAARVPAEGTLVLYMGLSTLRETARALVEAGRSERTPACVVSHATLPDQRVVVGDLGTIAELASIASLSAPALVIIGDVVARRVVSVMDSGTDIADAAMWTNERKTA
jgi:uroporphyrin-III C-methyltransferase